MRSDWKNIKENCSERKSVEVENEITSQSVRKPYPGIAQAFGILFLFIIAQIVIDLMISIPADALGIAETYRMLFTRFTATMVVLVFTYRKTKVPIREAFSLKAFNLMLVLPFIVTIIGISIIGSEIDNILRILVPMPTGLHDIMRGIATPSITGWTKAVFLAPLLEEALFRGVILHGFLKRYSTKKAIIASALLFGVIHLIPWQMIPAILAGIFLAWLLVYTRSLFACILGHMTMNAIPSILVPVLGLQIKGYSPIPVVPTVQFQPWWFDMLGVVMTCVGIAGIVLLKKLVTENYKSTTVNR